MPTKFNVRDIFISSDGGTTYTTLGEIGETELTPADDYALDCIIYGLQGMSGTFEIDRKTMYSLIGLTNNRLRMSGRRAIRWRKIKK